MSPTSRRLVKVAMALACVAMASYSLLPLVPGAKKIRGRTLKIRVEGDSPLDEFFPRTFFNTVPLWRDIAFEHDVIPKRHFSPDYETLQDENKIEVKIDLPGVKAKDINVEVRDGEVLHVSGGREKTGGGGNSTETRFETTFTLSKSVDQYKMKAHLADGVLTITAPIVEREENVVKVAITEGSVSSKDLSEGSNDGEKMNPENSFQRLLSVQSPVPLTRGAASHRHKKMYGDERTSTKPKLRVSEPARSFARSLRSLKR